MSDLGLRLVHGAMAFNLNEAGKCHLSRDFVPPATVETPVIASGAARSDGSGVVVSKRAAVHALTFTVKLIGDSGGDVQSLARDLQAMLQYAGDENDPLYLELRTSTDQPVPLWGQFGAPLLFEVLDGNLALSDDYGLGARRKRALTAQINLTLQPYGLGQEQRVGTATGGVLEDCAGSVKKFSRGLLIPEGNTNLHTNPVFGNATYDTNWTTGANLIKTQIIDHPVFDYSSVHLSAIGATNNTFYESITLTATTYTLSYYITLPDGSTPSSTQLQVVYDGAAQSSTYRQIEGGLYQVWAAVTGTAAAHTCGIVVKNGYTVILHGGQCEAKAYPTVLAHGDLPGCAWASTAHASSTTRTAAKCKVPIDDTIVQAAQGSLRIVARFDVPNTHPNSMFLFDLRDVSHTAAPALYYNQSDDKLYFQSNTSTISASGALTFSAGTTYVMHATWSAAGTALYINGTQVDTDAYVANTLGAALFIGSDYSGGNQLPGAILECATFETALTATQVATDYADILQVITKGARPGTVPWFWTTSGDNILGLDTGKYPYGIAGGVVGNAEAITEIRATASSDFATTGYLILNSFATRIPIPYYLLILDSSGAAAGGDYGGQHRNTTVDTSTKWQVSTSTSGGPGVKRPFAYELHRRQAIYLARLKAASATSLKIYASVIYASMYNDAKLITTNTSYRLVKTNPIILDLYKGNYTGLDMSSVVFGGVYATTLSGSLAVDVDYTAVLYDDVLIVLAASGTGIIARETETRYATATTVFNLVSSIGNLIAFAPNAYNHLQAYLGIDSSVDPLTTYTTTISALYVTPRWLLL